jgi:hypothetical protein
MDPFWKVTEVDIIAFSFCKDTTIAQLGNKVQKSLKMKRLIDNGPDSNAVRPVIRDR